MRLVEVLPEHPEKLRENLLAWGRRNFRRFPWRESRDPYHILVAEVLLHRTRAEQVVTTYTQLIAEYPDILTLASANPQDLIVLLYPLGLHWRSRLLHQMAGRIVTDFGGKIPAGAGELRSLPGVSRYIASAVRCFAFGFPEPLLDTNTVRVIGRILGIRTNDSTRRSNTFRNMVAHLVDREHPREFNFALLDLAAQLCTARGIPACNRCPLQEWCVCRQSMGQANALKGEHYRAGDLCQRASERSSGPSWGQVRDPRKKSS